MIRKIPALPGWRHRGLLWRRDARIGAPPLPVIVTVGTNAAVYSMDGGQTFVSTSIPNGSYTGVAFDGTKFVALAMGGTVNTHSPDGINWASKTALPAGLTGVGTNNFVWANAAQLFMAALGSAIYTSPDGIAWTNVQTLAGINTIGYNGARFVALQGSAGKYSDDTTTWTAITGFGTITGCTVAWNGSRFVNVANTAARTAWSSNGAAWNVLTNLPWASTGFTNVAWGPTPGVFCALRCNENRADGVTAATSVDGTVWAAQTMPASTLWQNVIWTGTRFLAVGTNACATSPDGITWTPGTIPNGVWKASALARVGV